MELRSGCVKNWRYSSRSHMWNSSLADWDINCIALQIFCHVWTICLLDSLLSNWGDAVNSRLSTLPNNFNSVASCPLCVSNLEIPCASFASVSTMMERLPRAFSAETCTDSKSEFSRPKSMSMKWSRPHAFDTSIVASGLCARSSAKRPIKSGILEEWAFALAIAS